mgnify:FL=1
MKKMKGITWAHSRGFTSIVAVSQRYSELHPEVEIVWEKRSLQKFADAPVEKLAEAYDLLIIDHPWAGFAAKHKILLPLQKYLSEDYLKDQEMNSVGASHISYNFDGYQSALAIDAATPIAVYRPDYFKDKKVPETFEEVLELAKQGVVAYAGIPINLLMDFYMFADNMADKFFTGDGMIDEESGCQILEKMRELASYCTKDMFGWDPISVHEVMASDNRIYYCPFTYGYTNYSRRGYAKYLLKVGDVVSLNGIPLHTVLGGTGLAVSSRTEYLNEAVDFAAYAASPEIQKTLFFDNGGQPGHRAAWVDEENNRRCMDFFKDTLYTLDHSYLRPRYSGYLDFQDHAGDFIRDYVMNGGNPKETICKMNKLYLRSKEEKS